MTYTCVCGCSLEEHLEGGLCLHTLECLCKGYAARALQPLPIGAEIPLPDGLKGIVLAYAQTAGEAPAVLLRLVADET